MRDLLSGMHMYTCTCQSHLIRMSICTHAQELCVTDMCITQGGWRTELGEEMMFPGDGGWGGQYSNVQCMYLAELSAEASAEHS